jgi:hypothetical protein
MKTETIILLLEILIIVIFGSILYSHRLPKVKKLKLKIDIEFNKLQNKYKNKSQILFENELSRLIIILQTMFENELLNNSINLKDYLFLDKYLEKKKNQIII